MKVAIEIKNRQEGEQLRAGLIDPSVRAFVCVAGILAGLPNDRSRGRVLRYVRDRFVDNPDETDPPPSNPTWTEAAPDGPPSSDGQ